MTTELEQEFERLILHDPVAYPSLGKVYVHIDGAPLDPADLTLMDQSGWRALSQGQGWTQSFMDRLSQLVDDWLSGSDRRELLSLARTPGSDEENFRPAELFRKWLDRERLGRLNALTADFDEIRPLAHYYAMSHALRAVLSAVGHTEAMPSIHWDSASSPIPEIAVSPNSDTTMQDDDISSWLV